MRVRNFSKDFFNWIFIRLADRHILYKLICNISHAKVGVPQGSILRTFLFNLRVADMRDMLDGSE